VGRQRQQERREHPGIERTSTDRMKKMVSLHFVATKPERIVIGFLCYYFLSALR